MSKINWPNVFLIVALALGATSLVVSLTNTPAPATPVSTQAFQCAPGTMCVQTGGKQVTFLTGSSLTIDNGAAFTYPYRGASTVTNTTVITHGLSTTPTMVLVSGAQTPTISAVSTLTFTAHGVTTGTVYWLALP